MVSRWAPGAAGRGGTVTVSIGRGGTVTVSAGRGGTVTVSAGRGGTVTVSAGRGGTVPVSAATLHSFLHEGRNKPPLASPARGSNPGSSD